MIIENLTLEHADEMFALLNDIKLHQHIGGKPIENSETFKLRYSRLAKGWSSDGKEEWINWIIKNDGLCVGYVQATISNNEAYIAWVVGTKYQNKGFASAATKILIEWLYKNRTNNIKANIGDLNEPSKRMAIKVGLVKTEMINNGESMWVYNNTSTTKEPLL
jgi:RimJ/RimL family protein N-acetyltransferase